MAVVTDDFNRANESPLASPWTKVGSGNNVNLVSNMIKSAASGSDTFYYNSSITPGTEQYAQAAFTNLFVARDWGPAVRVSAVGGGAGTGYFYDPETGAGICRMNGGAFSIMISDTPTLSNGDVLKITVAGTGSIVALEGFQNGVSRVTWNDSQAGRVTSAGLGVGFFQFNMDSGDNFEGGDTGSVAVINYGSVPRRMPQGV